VGIVRAGLATRFDGIPDVHYGDAERPVDDDLTLTGTRLNIQMIEVTGCGLYAFGSGKLSEWPQKI
jgi:hypothetical protein